MKWLVALLLIINVMVYLWVGGDAGRGAEFSREHRADVNKAGMLLLSESDTTARTSNIADGSSPATEKSVPTPVATCYRIGPFKQEAAWQAAMTWVEQQKIAFTTVNSARREFRAMHVFLGPYTEAQAVAMLPSLQQHGLEHFKHRIKDNQTRISLGYFTQKILANRFMAHLDTLGLAAQIQPVYQLLSPLNWLQIPIVDNILATLKQHNWRAENIKLVQIDC